MKIPKSNKQSDIIRFISRADSFERNGGGHFVSVTKVHKNRKKYNRNDKKKELRNHLNSYLFLIFLIKRFPISLGHLCEVCSFPSQRIFGVTQFLS